VRVFSIILDARPSYLRAGPAPMSLLLMPVGRSTLLRHVQDCLFEATRNPLTVLVPFEPGQAYEDAIREACPEVEGVETASSFANRLRGYEPSDYLVIADSRRVPARATSFNKLLQGLAEDPGSVRHLVKLETTPEGTQELVQLDAEGWVYRIQRYYEGITWPFTGSVVCSLLPVVSTLRGGNGLPFCSLSDLRTALASGGVTSRDVPFVDTVFDLDKEAGLLALSESLLLEPAREGSNGPEHGRPAGPRCRIDPSARIRGAVALHADVTIEEGATVLGPAVLGAGCHIGRRAVVAQCLVAPGTVVAAETSHRQRLLVGCADHDTPPNLDGPLDAAWGPPLALLEEKRRSIGPVVKSLVEGVLALLALIALAPLLVLIAVLIKLDSRGPVLYWDKREGRHGRTFHCLKFRTMIAGADARQRQLAAKNEVDGPQFKLEKDPRLTRLGRWLRPSSLDELPQLFNVVAGQMGLVGPRPSPFRENQMCIPWREARLSVRPGITGLWQVCRQRRSSGDFHQWIYYDLLYVRLMSPWLDLKILVATVLALGGKWCIPLSWILSPRSFHDRRRSPRRRDLVSATSLRRA